MEASRAVLRQTTAKMAMESLDPLQEELAQYEDKWVAILESKRKVVGSGNDAYEAKLDAEANGYPEIVLLRVPRFDRAYI
jgi:hypothetical protein